MRCKLYVLFTLLLAGCHSADQQLVEKFDDALYRSGKNTPAEFATDYVKHPWMAEAKKALSGQKSTWKRATARYWLNNLWGLIEAGREWNIPPPEVTIPRTASCITVDGRLDEPAWQQAKCWQGDYRTIVNEAAPFSTAHRQTASRYMVMHDRENLYFGASFKDSKLAVNPRQKWRGDSFEIFILPEPAMRCYWEMIVDADGGVYAAWNMKAYDGTILRARSLMPRRTQSAVQRLRDGFSVEIAFPLAGLPSLNGKLENFRFMMFRTHDVPPQQKAGCYDTPIPFLYDGHNLNGYIKGNFAE